MNKKVIITALIIILLTATAPLMAEEDFIDLNDYNLNLTIEQKSILKEELTTLVDISGEIDLGMIKIILGELEEENDYDQDNDYDYDESNSDHSFGQGLAQEIKRYKANNQNWTGKGLSNMIKNYMANNKPNNGKGNNKVKSNNGKAKGKK